MIRGFTLYFGSGDIAVGSNCYNQTVTFTNIKPPCECGETITKEMEKEIEFGKQIIIKLNDYDLYDLFCSVNENNTIIQYEKYTFDFTLYNKESIRVCKGHSKHALYIHQLTLAC